MNINEIRAKYPQYDGMSDADLAGALHKKFYPQLDETDFNQRIGLNDTPSAKVAQTSAAFTKGSDYDPEQIKAGLDPLRQKDAAERYKMQAKGYNHALGGFGAISDASDAGVFLGFDDELAGGMMAPIEATKDWFRGEGFDLGRGYDRIQKSQDLLKQMRREAYPWTSVAGEVMGGLAVPGMVRGVPTAAAPAASRMPTLFGKVPGMVAAPVEGAAYGAAYGAGEAKPGERLEGAERGAATGAALGTLMHTAGSGIARLARPKAPPPQAADQIAQEASQFYQTMRQSGVSILPTKINSFKAGMANALSGTNRQLAPKAFGIKRLADQYLTGQTDIGTLHNFAKSVNRVLRSKLEGEDAHYVGLIKDEIQGLLDNITPGDITGANTTQAFQAWKQADELWGRQKRTALVEGIMEQAGVDATGRYTQSGLANSIRREMNKLYKQIKSGRSKGWSPEEIVLIKQMASGGSNSKVVNLLAKFSPRGVVSAGAGYLLGGPLLNAAGYAAGHMADQGAASALTRLQGTVSGGRTITPPMPQNMLDPLIPGGAAANTDILRRLTEAGLIPRQGSEVRQPAN